eukprot:1180311-Amphidinium_carterae.1
MLEPSVNSSFAYPLSWLSFCAPRWAETESAFKYLDIRQFCRVDVFINLAHALVVRPPHSMKDAAPTPPQCDDTLASTVEGPFVDY